MRKAELLKPIPLKEGDHIGIVAPSTGHFIPEILNSGIEFFKTMGFKVVLPDGIFNKRRSGKKDDKERADWINEMFADKKIRAIFCATGGARSEKIIPFLNRSTIVDNPKYFFGYSDITSILLYLTEVCDMLVFHGPMVCNELNNNTCRYKKDIIFKLLTGKTPSVFYYKYCRTIKGGTNHGRITGGCLALIAQSFGTDYEINTRDSILFLEDIGESFSFIEKLLLKLEKNGKFDSIRGIIFGEMFNCGFKRNIEYNQKYFDKLVKKFFSKYDFPIMTGFSAGHGYGKYTLPLGLRVSFNSDRKTIRFLEAI